MKKVYCERCGEDDPSYDYFDYDGMTVCERCLLILEGDLIED